MPCQITIGENQMPWSHIGFGGGRTILMIAFCVILIKLSDYASLMEALRQFLPFMVNRTLPASLLLQLVL